MVQGDLDLSRYRYASLNPHTPLTGVYGSGEVGNLVIRRRRPADPRQHQRRLRAAAPDVKQDAKGWRLLPGVDYTGGDMVTPHAGVELAAGTQIPGGVVLNYGVTLSSFTLEPGSVLPVTAALAQPLTLPAGAILSAAVFNADGSVALAAGTVLAQPARWRRARNGRRLAHHGHDLPGHDRMARGHRALPNLPNVPYGSNLLTLARNVIPRARADSVRRQRQAQSRREYVDLRPVVNDAQGKVWAVAPMLPEGSQSWSMRLVGGADLTAPTRAPRNMASSAATWCWPTTTTACTASTRPATLWTQQGADDIGMPWLAGTVIDEQFIIDNFGYPR